MTLLAITWAAFPLAIYFLWVGCLQLRARPTVLSGFADTLAIGLGLSGLMIVGPCQLFLPEAAANRFGGLAHVLVAVLYGLLMVLVALTRKPRIVIYNVTPRQLQPLLWEVVQAADSALTVVGRCATLPTLGIDFALDLQPDSRTAQLCAISRELDLRHWRRLRLQVQNALRNVRGTPNPRAAGLILAGCAALTFIAYVGVTQWPALARGWEEWLRR